MKKTESKQILAIEVIDMKIPKEMNNTALVITLRNIKAFKELGFDIIFMYAGKKNNVYYAFDNNIIYKYLDIPQRQDRIKQLMNPEPEEKTMEILWIYSQFK